MEERLARYLICVVEQGSFTRAAEKLHVSQPALSQQIKQLEERLGAKLVDRSSRRVTATDVGKAYLEHAARALRELEAAKRAVHDVRSLERGELRLAFTPTFTTYLIGPLAHTYMESYPSIHVTVEVLAQQDIEIGLAEDRFDLGVAPSLALNEEIESRTVGEEHLNCVLGTGHHLAAHRSISDMELATLKLALLGQTFATRTLIDWHFSQNNLRPQVSLESNSVETLVSIVRRGGFATILPEFAGHRIAGTCSIPLSPPIPARPICLLKRKGGYRSFASLAFEQLTSSPDWLRATKDPTTASVPMG